MRGRLTVVGVHARSWACSALCVVVALAAPACQSRSGEPRGTRQNDARVTRDGELLVSTVDREGITLGEVEELVLAGLAPPEALRRLQAQSLLMSEAERRGVSDDGAVRQIGRQAAVQALLERETEAVTVTDDELREAYESQRARFEIPERRSAVHVMVRVPPRSPPDVEAKASAFVRRAIGELERAADVDAFLRSQAERSVDGMQVVAERLPEVTKAGAPGALGAAVFGLKQPGVVPQPIRSAAGWHALRVLKIVPPEATISFERAIEQLRPELLVNKRQKHVEALVAALRQKYHVTITQNAAADLAALTVQ